MTRRRYWSIFSLRFFGYVVILTALTWLGYWFYPVVKVELTYKITGPAETKFQPKASPFEAAKIATPPAAKPTPTPHPKPQALPTEPVNRDFSIVVPKIGANAQVMANVDTADYEEYQKALKLGVAHAQGTVLPGEIGNSYYFAHSTLNAWDVPRYNAIFYLLGELEPGDRVVLFYQGNQYDYEVTDKIIAEANDTSWLTAQYNEPTLTLQTCTPPGTTWKRLMVIAHLVAWDD